MEKHLSALDLNAMVQETVNRMRKYAAPGRRIKDIARGVAREYGYGPDDVEWVAAKIHSGVSARSGLSQKGKKRGARRASRAAKPNKTPTLAELERHWGEGDFYSQLQQR